MIKYIISAAPQINNCGLQNGAERKKSRCTYLKKIIVKYCSPLSTKALRDDERSKTLGTNLLETTKRFVVSDKCI